MSSEYAPVISGGKPYVGISLSVLARLAAVVEAASLIFDVILVEGRIREAHRAVHVLGESLDAPEIARMWEDEE